MSLTGYFTDIPMKRQKIAVTALFEFQVIVADFILVSFFALSIVNLTSNAKAQVYRLYYVWKPYWWLCVAPTLAWVGAWGQRFSVFGGTRI